MNNKNIKKEVIHQFISNSPNNNMELKIFLGLYSNYCKLQKVVVNSSEEKLKYYEDEIYIIDDEIISDIGRIKIEINRIKSEISKEIDNKVDKYIQPALEEIEQLLMLNDETLREFIVYIKKKLVKLQILLGLNVTFYNSAYELFISEYTKVEEKIKEKTRR